MGQMHMACRLCERQTESGGLNGRPEKREDVGLPATLSFSLPLRGFEALPSYRELLVMVHGWMLPCIQEALAKSRFLPSAVLGELHDHPLHRGVEVRKNGIVKLPFCTHPHGIHDGVLPY